MSKNKKFTPLIFIPIAVAVFVLIFLAVSGHLTKTEDIKKAIEKKVKCVPQRLHIPHFIEVPAVSVQKRRLSSLILCQIVLQIYVNAGTCLCHIVHLKTTKVFKSASIQSGNEITSGANFEGSLNFLVFGKPRYSEIAHCLSRRRV